MTPDSARTTRCPGKGPPVYGCTCPYCLRARDGFDVAVPIRKTLDAARTPQEGR